MQTKVKGNIMKNLLLASSFLLITGFTACSDNNQKADETKAAKAPNSAPVIEVSHNENAKAIKVKEKVSDANQSKSYYLDYNVKSAYDQNSQPANHDASVRVKPRTSIDANMHVRSPYEKVQVSLLVRKMSKEFIVKCSACHNDYANGIIGPSLLNKDSDYIFNKIAEFKNGTKSNPLMTDLIKQMSDNEIRTMAEEIYNFNLEINNMKEK